MELMRRFRERVDATPSLQWRSARHPALASSLFGVGTKDRDAREVERTLAAQDIWVRPFARPLNLLRVSPNLVNTVEDLERFMRVTA
jgi:selenocysteine lyase/cysteine desulfurase